MKLSFRTFVFLGLAWASVGACAQTEAVNIPPARDLGLTPDVVETFDADTIGRQPTDWVVINSIGGIDCYDAHWRVVNIGAPLGNVVSTTTVYDTGPGTYLSHLSYQGTSGSIVGGRIPRDSHYYVEALLHMKADVANWANEHTLQGIVQDDYNLEVLIWSSTNGSKWGLRLYSNGGEGIIADWGRPGEGITDNTGQTGWNWWGRVGMDIDLTTAKVSVYYNGQQVIAPITVASVATIAVPSGKDILIDLRATNNLMDGDDIRIYLIRRTALSDPGTWSKIKGGFH